jgi:alpha-glucosidase
MREGLVSRVSRAAHYLLCGIALAMTTGAAVPARALSMWAGDNVANDVTVARTDMRTFKVFQSGTPAVLLTFLTARSLRVQIAGDDDPAAKIPEYMRVKAEASYPFVDVKVAARPDEATFSTSLVSVHLAASDGIVTLNIRAGSSGVIEHWTIDARHRSARLDLRADEHIFGFGDKRAALDQRGQRLEMVNRDAFASETNDSYKSIPFYMSTAGYGLFFHNFYPSVFDVGASAENRLQLTASGGPLDFYVFLGDLKDILSQYTELTGRPAMLPRWAFGYHQGKASYQGAEGFDVAAQMRRRKLPVDVIYYDDLVPEAATRDFIDSLWRKHHVRLTLGFGMPMFGTFRGSRDDSALVKSLAAQGFLMVDQHNRPVIGASAYVDSDKQTSSVAYLDYFSPSAVDHIFAAKWDRALMNGAILGMVDFGEMDHVSDADRKFWPSLGLSVAKTRNLFGLVYPLSVVGGTARRTGARSTGMVRPGFAGSQRLGWATTGDSVPTYRNFRAHTRGLLNLTLSGFSNVGQDIGGWDGKGPATLYARWFAAGTFFPFMWSHGQGEHEPYAHGATVEAAARGFLDLRYRLIPYLYSLHELAHRRGIPVLRSLALQESTDPVSARIDDQFFVGDDLLVAPLFNDEGDRQVYLPSGRWYDFFGESEPVEGGRGVWRQGVPLDRIPLYVRAGAIIPLGPAMQYSSEKPVDPLAIHAYAFAPQDQEAGPQSNEFSLYEDDGQSTAYQRGRWQRTLLRFKQGRSVVKLEVETESGTGKYHNPGARAYDLHFHGFRCAIDDVLLDGRRVPPAGTRSVFRPIATWSRDAATGELKVLVPHSGRHRFTVQFATPSSCTRSAAR